MKKKLIQKEKGGYKHAKVNNSAEIPGGGGLHLRYYKGLNPLAIAACLSF